MAGGAADGQNKQQRRGRLLVVRALASHTCSVAACDGLSSAVAYHACTCVPAAAGIQSEAAVNRRDSGSQGKRRISGGWGGGWGWRAAHLPLALLFHCAGATCTSCALTDPAAWHSLVDPGLPPAPRLTPALFVPPPSLRRSSAPASASRLRLTWCCCAAWWPSWTTTSRRQGSWAWFAHPNNNTRGCRQQQSPSRCLQMVALSHLLPSPRTSASRRCRWQTDGSLPVAPLIVPAAPMCRLSTLTLDVRRSASRWCRWLMSLLPASLESSTMCRRARTARSLGGCTGAWAVPSAIDCLQLNMLGHL